MKTHISSQSRQRYTQVQPTKYIIKTRDTIFGGGFNVRKYLYFARYQLGNKHCNLDYKKKKLKKIGI